MVKKWEEADLKYRALKMVLPSDDPNIRYIEKHFSVCRDEIVIDDVVSCVCTIIAGGTLYKKLIVAKILPRHHQFVFAFNFDMGYETNIPWIEAI